MYLNGQLILAFVLLTGFTGCSAQSSKEEARQSARQRMNIAMAFHGRRTMFPAVVVDEASGEEHSWRVALLPYIRGDAVCQEIYSEYRFEESWDSPHNRQVTIRMPDVYRCPGGEPETSETGFFVVTGKGTLFDGPQGVALDSIEDGTSNTALLFESTHRVHWAKPEDLSIDDPDLLEKLTIGSRVRVALADGRVFDFKASEFDEGRLREILLANDGKGIWNW